MSDHTLPEISPRLQSDGSFVEDEPYAGYECWLDFVATCAMAEAADEAAGETIARGFDDFNSMMAAAERESRDV